MSEFDLEAIRARDAACAVPKAPIEAVQWAQSNADRRALLAAYDALRSRLAEAELARDSWKSEAELNQQAADESANYAAQLAEAERDSQRYRWLVNCNDAGVWAFLAGMDDDQIDEAIDKWMAEE